MRITYDERQVGSKQVRDINVLICIITLEHQSGKHIHVDNKHGAGYTVEQMMPEASHPSSHQGCSNYHHLYQASLATFPLQQHAGWKTQIQEMLHTALAANKLLSLWQVMYFKGTNFTLSRLAKRDFIFHNRNQRIALPYLCCNMQIKCVTCSPFPGISFSRHRLH